LKNRKDSKKAKANELSFFKNFIYSGGGSLDKLTNFTVHTIHTIKYKIHPNFMAYNSEKQKEKEKEKEKKGSVRNRVVFEAGSGERSSL